MSSGYSEANTRVRQPADTTSDDCPEVPESLATARKKVLKLHIKKCCPLKLHIKKCCPARVRFNKASQTTGWVKRELPRAKVNTTTPVEITWSGISPESGNG
jgi:hypothetical protein